VDPTAAHRSTGPRHGGTGRPERPLRRSVDGCFIGGVCGGVARRFGVSARAVRIVFALLALLGGFGLALYVVLWVLVERRGETATIASRIVSDRRELQILLAVSTVVLALLITFEALGLSRVGNVAWPLSACAIGILAVWRGASAQERVALQEMLSSLPVGSLGSSRSWKSIAVRVAGGIALVLIGITMLSKVGQQPHAARGALLGAVVLGTGFLVLFAPWWLHTIRDLTTERRERVRAQERADVAAHLHDSVLQTLSLIQRNADDPKEVARLARLQERELRGWLFNPATFGQRDRSPRTIVEAAASVERDIEDSYGVAVELVVVGDGPLDDAAAAMIAAGREATVNAAKWAQAPRISVYVEVEPDLLSMYVRDQGIGFDVDAVPSDRKGISCSITERMVRYGGRATVRSTLGEGTDVELTLPRTPSGT